MTKRNREQNVYSSFFFLLFYAAQICYTGNGKDYRGDIKITESGKLCQDWTSQTPHKHNYTPLV